MLPISKTGGSAADMLAIIHFLYPKLVSFSEMEYCSSHLHTRTRTFPKRSISLNKMQFSPSFNGNKQNDPTTCWWYQLSTQYRVVQQERCPSYPSDCVGRVIETPNCLGGKGAAPNSNPINGGTSFKILPVLYI